MRLSETLAGGPGLESLLPLLNPTAEVARGRPGRLCLQMRESEAPRG